jgi:hypothetical protein
MSSNNRISQTDIVSRWLYRVTFVALAFTGFGQMPIFKRYYISDIPGMAWSADFYFTHYLHYIGASILLALIAYFVLDYIFMRRRLFKLTVSAYIRIALLGGIVLTGIVRVLKNLPDIVFSPEVTMFVDIAHLGFMMMYMAIACILARYHAPWLAERSPLRRP